MKSLYNKAKHSFQEQQIPLPDQRDYIGNDKDYAEAYHAYAHQQPTRTIACRPGDVWEEGRLYEEGEDYVISSTEVWPDGTKALYWDKIILPLKSPPPAQEAELWKDLMKKIFGISSFFDKPMEELFEKEIADLQTKYQLSLKSEQPEAIQFAEWMAMNHVVCGERPNGSPGFLYKEKSITADELVKEYQIFKQRKAP